MNLSTSSVPSLQRLVASIRHLFRRQEPPAPAAVTPPIKPKERFLVEVIELHGRGPVIEPTDSTDPHDRWFHRIN